MRGANSQASCESGTTGPSTVPISGLGGNRSSNLAARNQLILLACSINGVRSYLTWQFFSCRTTAPTPLIIYRGV